LWRGYRGALAFAERLAVRPPRAAASPCETCVARPCLSACPVGAFTGGGYNVAVCAAHLSRSASRACMEGGCLARRACPVGAGEAHERAQAAFHMRAFLAARSGR
jgi:Fe-S-cluster-containing hydrogenase component 2